MVAMNSNVFFRFATVEDFEEVLDFYVKNGCSAGTLMTALNFSEDDRRELLIAKVRFGLPDGLTILAFDKSTQQLVGCNIFGLWHRNRKHSQQLESPKSERGRIFHAFSETLRSHFWDLCPRNVDTVARGENTLVRSDYRRQHIGAQMMQIQQKKLIEMKIQGAVGVVSSIANQNNVKNFGAIALAELSYATLAKAYGIPLDVVGASKAVLAYSALDGDDSFKPEVVIIDRIECKL